MHNLKKNMIRIIFFAIIISLKAYSQDNRFSHITSKDGLSQSEVYCFLKDSRGFMWFGTLDGLNKYDGYSIEIYNTELGNKNSLSNNTIRSLAEDTNGRIWIGTDDGLNMYSPEKEMITQIIPVSASSQKLNVNTLLVYEDYLYVGTGNGLFRIKLKENIDIQDEVFVQRVLLDNQTNNATILNLKKCSTGGIWLQTNDFVSRIDIENKNSKAIVLETPIIETTTSLFDILEDKLNNIWVSAVDKGVLRYNLISKQKKWFTFKNSPFGLSSSKCSDLALDQSGNLWIGTLDAGINMVSVADLNNKNISFKKIKHNPFNPATLNSNLVRTLFISEDNILWAGTIGSGINYLDFEQKNFNNLRINSATKNGSNFVRAVYLKSKNKLWVGAHNDGLYEIDRSKDVINKLGFENITVFYISPYKDNRYFICSSNGIYLVEAVNEGIKILSHKKTSAVFNVTRDGADNIWVASFLGLKRIRVIDNNIVLDATYALNSGKQNAPVNCRVLFYEPEFNKLIVGTEGEGLHVLTLDQNYDVVSDKKYKISESKAAICNNYIRSIVKDSLGTYWIGTFEGLNKIEDHHDLENLKFSCYTTKNGLPNNMINSIIEDDFNNLWIGTNNGLSRFNVLDNTFTNYFESDGVQSNEFSEHTSLKTQLGEIIIGGVNGISAFFPSSIKNSNRKPQTTITDFFINNERIYPNNTSDKDLPLSKGIAVSDTINLNSDQNNIGFNFSSMLYPNADKTTYAYLLEGFDQDWHYTNGINNYARYTNLNYGDYTFKVKSANADGVWQDKPEEIFVHIKTPLKYTWPAILLYCIIAVFIIIYFSRYSIIKINAKNKLLLEKAHTDKVKALNKMRTQFFINISHDLRTPLTLIKGPLDSILSDNQIDDKLKTKLLLIRRNVKRLNYLIEQLLDVRRSEKQKLHAETREQDIIEFTKQELSHFSYAINQKGLKSEVKSPHDSIVLKFDAGMLSKVYFNIISNALKYTDTGKITVTIDYAKKVSESILSNSDFNDFVKVEIKDTGIGISKDKLKKVFKRYYQENSIYGSGYGIGLSHTQQLIEAHQGFIEAESNEVKGTTIRFFIPVKDLSSNLKTAKLNEDDIYRTQEDQLLLEQTETDDNQKKTVLIVEDNADMRSYIKTEITELYNVLEAEDGLKGLELTEEHDIDLIISDVMMPNLDGIKFCEKIKSNLSTSHIPVILLTAKSESQSKYQGLEIGADDYISKPFEMEHLTIRIKNLIQSREKLKELFQKEGFSFEPSAIEVNSLDEKFLNDVMAEIEKAIPDSEFSISTLEELMGMSHSNFYRKLKSLTGKSGKEILNEMRMKRAKQILLTNKKVRIDEVAYMVGFSDPRYFGKIFKDTFKVSPTQMKKNT
jgi:signal transduction histidine kinase/ligand-binding sensor domain-containing protein/DNA-binding response OmpR family regulator